VQPAVVNRFATVENTTPELTVTGKVFEVEKPLLTVSVTLHVPAFITVSALAGDVLDPAATEQPAVPTVAVQE
jgi:hypothetical protein